ncbi:MAG: bifunctional uridylyltransferase/uridylyl-removing protein, partial [Altererythrobacter sp.]|nr:bifunctional uridylyltransferase/uridylyl-removing protein [Altererythrobacter sp.]
MNSVKIPRQRAIVDRRKTAEAINALVAKQGDKARRDVVSLLKDVLDKGRTEIAKRLEEKPSAGHECVAAQALLIDQILRLVHDHVIEHVYPVGNRSSAEKLAILAVGGYGRAEMAPHSDVDIAFITPIKRAAWCEQVIEAMLYFLWDLGLKVGQSSRTVDETIRMAKEDLTIRTALLESRFIWGDRDLYEETGRRFWAEVAKGSERQFLTQKLEERDARHKRMGDSR